MVSEANAQRERVEAAATEFESNSTSSMESTLDTMRGGPKENLFKAEFWDWTERPSEIYKGVRWLMSRVA